MKNKSKHILTVSALLTALAGFNSIAQAATVTWDGGGTDTNWTTEANWDGNGSGTAGVPGTSDTVIINNGDTVIYNSETLTNSVNIILSNNSSLNSNGTVFRLSDSTITVESGSSLGGGGFWDLDGATLSFKDGATVNMNHWEQKDLNVFNFELSASGFTAITPGAFRLGNGSLTGNISNATYNVDMANYTGGIGTIVLANFASDAASMNNATFQGAGGLNVLNAGSYTAALQWNDTTEAIELNVTAIPEPGTYALISGCLALGAVMLRRRRA